MAGILNHLKAGNFSKSFTWKSVEGNPSIHYNPGKPQIEIESLKNWLKSQDNAMILWYLRPAPSGGHVILVTDVTDVGFVGHNVAGKSTAELPFDWLEKRLAVDQLVVAYFISLSVSS